MSVKWGRIGSGKHVEANERAVAAELCGVQLCLGAGEFADVWALSVVLGPWLSRVRRSVVKYSAKFRDTANTAVERRDAGAGGLDISRTSYRAVRLHFHLGTCLFHSFCVRWGRRSEFEVPGCLSRGESAEIRK